MKKIILRIIAATLGIFLASKFVSGVSLKIIPDKSIYFGIKFTEDWQILIFIGTILGLINFFIKPILNLITLPLRILTLNSFSLFLNMLIIWALDKFFPELEISNLTSLFLTTIIVSFLNFLFNLK